jgi:hypothetical protein
LSTGVLDLDWFDIARRLDGLGPHELDQYVGDTLTRGQRARVREAAMVAGRGRVIAAIDKNDPQARAIAEAFWSYEQTVILARDTGVWDDVAAHIARLADADLCERLSELDRSERVAIGDATREQRVLDAIHWLDGAKGSVRS